MKRKFELSYIHFYNYANYAPYFEEQAAQGWMLKKLHWGGLITEYQRTQPQALRFVAVPFEKEKILSGVSQAEVRDFHDLCLQGGWQFAANTVNTSVFYHPVGEVATPIYSEPADEYAVVARMMKRDLIAHCINTLVILLIVWMITGILFYTPSGIRSNLNIGAWLTCIVALPGSLLALTQNLYFRRRNRQVFQNPDRPMIFLPRHAWGIGYYTVGLVLLFIGIYGGTLLGDIVGKSARGAWIIGTGMLPTVIGVIIGLLFRKRIRNSMRYRLLTKGMQTAVAMGILILASIAGMLVTVSILMTLPQWPESNTVSDQLAQYGVLSARTLVDGSDIPTREDMARDGRDLWEESSVFVPVSYTYYEHGDLDLGCQVNVCRSTAVAEFLLQRYLTELESAEQARQRWRSDADPELETAEPVTFLSLDPAVWHVDAGYRLAKRRDQVLLRKGTIVYLLEGLDFEDPQTPEQVRRIFRFE